jgi:hypothetical protein
MYRVSIAIDSNYVARVWTNAICQLKKKMDHEMFFRLLCDVGGAMNFTQAVLVH